MPKRIEKKNTKGDAHENAIPKKPRRIIKRKQLLTLKRIASAVAILLVIFIIVSVLPRFEVNDESRERGIFNRPGSSERFGDVTLSSEPPAATLGSDFRVYEDFEIGFSVEVPNAWGEEVVYGGDDVMTFLFQHPTDRGGFQVYTYPYAGPETFTSSFLAGEVEGAVVTNPTEITLDDGQRAIIFESIDETIGRTREVWFIRNGRMWQVTGYVDQDQLLSQILATLRFF